MADEGITVIIANGKRDNILVKIMNNEELNYTRFIPSRNRYRASRNGLRTAKGLPKANCTSIIVPPNCSSRTKVSILPVGITDVIGEFEKDDIVRIIDFGGKPIGVGKANCDSSQARETMGKHGKKPVVHYDYLYIE